MSDFLAELLGIVLEILVEAFGQLLLELCADAVARLFRRLFRTSKRIGPLASTLALILCGAGVGYLSVMLFPHPLTQRSHFHGVSLLISPLITGSVMALLGQGLRRRGRMSIAIESFRYGFAFAFAMALVRFVLVR